MISQLVNEGAQECKYSCNKVTNMPFHVKQRPK